MLFQFIESRNPDQELDISVQSVKEFLIKVKMTDEANVKLVDKQFINRIEINLKCNSICMLQPDILEHPVHKWLFPLTDEQKTSLNNFVLRVQEIVHKAYQTNNTVIIDAEQTFVQKFIDVLVEQLQYKYNYKQFNKSVVINTIQVNLIRIILSKVLIRFSMKLINHFFLNMTIQLLSKLSEEHI